MRPPRLVALSACSLWMMVLSFGKAQAADTSPADPFQPIRLLAGEWQGTADGMGGTGTAVRSYRFVLKDRYLYEQDTHTYPAQEKNPQGEKHEHWAFWSYDRQAKRLMLRQFHPEGFVNLYSFRAELSTTAKLVFESEGFENFDSRWKARETYELVSPDEFTETFELAQPGGSFEVYSRTRFLRQGK